MMQRPAGSVAPVRCATSQMMGARRHSRSPATATPALPMAQVRARCIASRFACHIGHSGL